MSIDESLLLAKGSAALSFKEFLETVPPGRQVRLLPSDVERKYAGSSPYLVLKIPRLSLYCGHPSCDRSQYFQPKHDESSLGDLFLYFICRNCAERQKTFA